MDPITMALLKGAFLSALNYSYGVSDGSLEKLRLGQTFPSILCTEGLIFNHVYINILRLPEKDYEKYARLYFDNITALKNL